MSHELFEFGTPAKDFYKGLVNFSPLEFLHGVPFKNENEVVITESISVSLFGNDNSIVRVRNWKLSDLHRKITKGVKLVDYKTKWSWYDLRISIHGDSQMNNLADSIEEWYFKVGERKELLDIASEAGIDAHLESNQEIIEILEEKGLWN